MTVKLKTSRYATVKLVSTACTKSLFRFYHCCFLGYTRLGLIHELPSGEIYRRLDRGSFLQQVGDAVLLPAWTRARVIGEILLILVFTHRPS